MTRAATRWLLGSAVASMAACRPLPSESRSDAGLARLTGVTLRRMEKDRVRLELRAPDALMGLDGDRLVMNRPEGEGHPADGGPVHLRAARLDARLARGEAVLLDAAATDSSGRTLRGSRVTLLPDGGAVFADGPVTVTGPNFRAVAAGGARVDLASEAVDLVGPVGLRTLDADGGALDGGPAGGLP
jgi:hypothetical protein